MQWIEAALAFALTMIVFSTIVTVITEVILRALRSREKNFRSMVEQLFDQIVWPRVRERLSGLAVDTVRNRFVEALTSNPLAAGAASPINRLSGRMVPRTVSSMTVMELMERIGDTEIGTAIAAGGADYINDAINDLAQKYDRFCRGAHESFAAHAKAWSVAISIALAFALNVDAVRVFVTYLNDGAIRQAVIAQENRILNGLDEARRSLAAVEAQVAEAGTPADGRLDQVRASMERVAAAASELSTLGVPVGFGYFPGCAKLTADGMPVDPSCAAGGGIAAAGAWLGWIGSVLLAGLLIGLGAPFWFDLARGLSRGARALRLIGLGGQEPPPEKAGEPSVAGATAPPRTPVEAFLTSLRAAAPADANRLASVRSVAKP
jgi:hypothetical protein